jgi:hypothetical protein
MDLVKQVPVRERVLIRARDGEGLQGSLEVARGLRDAGYVAEFDLGYEETSGIRWIVDMRSGEGIELIDQIGGEQLRAESPTELLNLIQKAGRK